MAVALALVAGCTRPTHDQAVLKAINGEAQNLMASQPAETPVRVPKNRWPRGIAGLNPEGVTIFSSGVDIKVKAEFDDDWGYFVPRNELESPEPRERFSAIGQGVYWYVPY
ncbi:MAG: hypothetical protein ABI240_09720 [Sphingomonas sp.]